MKNLTTIVENQAQTEMGRETKRAFVLLKPLLKILLDLIEIFTVIQMFLAVKKIQNREKIMKNLKHKWKGIAIIIAELMAIKKKL